MNDNSTICHRELDLHDGMIKYYEKKDDLLIVSISTWNETVLRIIFDGVIALVDTFATNSDLEELQEFCRTNALPTVFQNHLNLLVEVMYCSQSDIDNAHHFRFRSTDDIPLLDILCK